MHAQALAAAHRRTQQAQTGEGDCLLGAGESSHIPQFGQQDRGRRRPDAVPQVMAAFRNVAIGLLRRTGYANVAAARRYLAANPKQALRMIGCQITE